MTNSRLPEDYSIPQPAGNYVKLAQGTTKLRILSQPIVGRLDRQDLDGKKKPLRYPVDKKPATVYDPKGLKHFWAVAVYNYELEAVQIREITQKSIMNAITSLTSDEDYKDIYSYDLKITKEGEKMETKYSILPGKATELDPNITQLYFDAMINLEELFKGGNPFGND